MSNSISYRLPSNNTSVERCVAMRLKGKKPPTIIVALTFHWECVNQSHKAVRNETLSETLFGTKQTTTTTMIPQHCDETFYLSKSHDVRNVVCYYSRITIKFILFYSILFGDVFFCLFFLSFSHFT